MKLLLKIIGLLVLQNCQQNQTVFKLLDATNTGVDFVNRIEVSDSLNILTTEFVYNGGGVAIGDLNGDQLPDLFFSGNQVPNACYLNLGELTFKDITKEASLAKRNAQNWSSGINILDINLDGRQDIYVCNTLRKDSTLRRNLLYINQGNNEAGIPQFEEMASAYGVDDASHSSHAQFFDYDLDGDLDLFIGVNFIEDRYPNQFITITNDGSGLNRDLLLRNDWNEALGHPVFTDVSLESGLLQDGYSHSTLIHDFNQDGWPDIYVANDYQSNDLIFINNQDGTFTNQAGKIFKHFSLSAMGSDVGDVNNDGAADFITSEMQPYYNKRKKLFQGGSNYQNTKLTEEYGYDYQYTRNTLQLNLGTNPETGLPIFSEVGMYAQVQETDWSWSTLFADYDNDGWKDLFIANGFPKDVTDRDFADFRAMASNLVSWEDLYEAIPAVKYPNFLFRNTGELRFENVSKPWGIEIPSFSNGASYVDLDQDGDLDLVTNNIDDPAFVFENQTIRNGEVPENAHYLAVLLKGSAKNPDAFGAAITIQVDGQTQSSYLISGRGYLSKSENTIHFGLGTNPMVDKLTVQWPDGHISQLKDISGDQKLIIQYEEAKVPTIEKTEIEPLFIGAEETFQIQHKSQDLDFVDFYFQRTLPHKFSQYGPAVVAGDVNGDGATDLLFGAGASFPETWFFQQQDGRFQANEQFYKNEAKQREEDQGILMFDVEGDGDLDVYLARGSSQYPGSS